ncbi:MAG: rRNA maturation RNase YbeY [Firmicutes bacterium]|nr:rRNA maturation RNase YbeY [Bacillota bacterium]
MNIYLEEGQVLEDSLVEKMEKAAAFLFEKEGVDAERAEVSLTLVEPEEIKELNAEYRDVDKVTDVLSFPQYEGVWDMPEEGELCLGDVVICVERAKEQAEEYGHSYEREFVYLFVHSLLHLLGYDHMEDEEKAVMREKEEMVMSHIDLER